APARVDAATVAAMAVAVHAVRAAIPLPIGVNVLKSDALSALAVASATADVQAKHAVPLAPVPIEMETRDAVARGLADGLVVTGVATGEPTAMTDLKKVRGAAPGMPLLVGSGAT